MSKVSRDSAQTPATLLVIGGASAAGHWALGRLGPFARLADGAAPGRVLVADTDPDVADRLPAFSTDRPSAAIVVEAVHLAVAESGHVVTSPHDTLAGRTLSDLAADADEVWVTVAPDDLAPVARSIAPGLSAGDTPVLVFSAAQVLAAEVFDGAAHPPQMVGLHVLVGPDTVSPVGHTAVVCIDPELDAESRQRTRTLAMLGTAGMRPILLSPTDHDRAMAWVEGVSEFVLLSLGAALVDSGVPLELLWEVRTPTFQLLAALVARTYDTVRFEQVASAQLSASRTDPLVRESLHRAVADLGRRVNPSVGATTEELIAELDRVARGLPTWFRRSLAQGSEGAVEAVRSTERELMAASQDATLVGIRRLSGGRPTHVGRVIAGDDDRLELDDRLVDTPFGAVVVDTPWAEQFLAMVGIDARVGPVSLRVHNHATVTGVELDAWRDGHLARYRLVMGVDWSVGESPNVDLGEAVALLAPQAVEAVEVTDAYNAQGLTRVTVEARVRIDHDPESVVQAWTESLARLLTPGPTVRHSVPGAVATSPPR